MHTQKKIYLIITLHFQKKFIMTTKKINLILLFFISIQSLSFLIFAILTTQQVNPIVTCYVALTEHDDVSLGVKIEKKNVVTFVIVIQDILIFVQFHIFYKDFTFVIAMMLIEYNIYFLIQIKNSAYVMQSQSLYPTINDREKWLSLFQ